MKTVAQNRRARFDYAITDTIEAGIILTGPEVKSARLGNVQLAGSYLSFLGGKPILKNASIAQYAFAVQDPDYQPGRDRVLLLKKVEADRMQSMLAEKGVTVVPLEMKAGKYIKLILAVGRGRKTIDKRQRIKERETGRRLREGKDV